MDKADISWLLVSTLLVLMMAVPGLAMFYGGLVRSKNVLSVLLQVLCTFVLGLVLWFIYGYSSRLTEGNAPLRRTVACASSPACSRRRTASTPCRTRSPSCCSPRSSHLRRHHLRAGCGQLRRTRPLLGGAGLHGDLVHLRLRAHRPHGLVRVETAPGLLNARGALDFAGGTVVHINAGVAGLVGAYVIGKRVGWPRSHAAAQPAHDLRRRRAAVGGLVRLQRRLGPGRQRKRHAGLLQHHDRDRRRRAGLADHRMEHQGQAVHARRGLGRGSRPGRHHPGRRAGGSRGRAGHRRDRRRRLRLGREWPEAHPARRRLAGRVRRAAWAASSARC